MAEFLAADRPRIALVSHLVKKHDGRSGLRILDLACRTGAFSYALASQGHWVLGLEGRLANLDQAHMHPNVEYRLGDVRDLSRGQLGTFDVVLCLGLLYHLEADDVLALLRAMVKVTKGFVILDTHISNAEQETTIENATFYGHTYPEPEGDWSSVGNEASWWFTQESLERLVFMAGWSMTSVDSPEGISLDRRWFLLRSLG